MTDPVPRLTGALASYSWLHPTPDSGSGAFIWLKVDSILCLTQVLVARYEFQLIYPATDSSLVGWNQLAAVFYVNISSKFKDLFCKINHFMVCFLRLDFSTTDSGLAAASRILKKLEEAWGSLKKLQDPSCDWF